MRYEVFYKNRFPDGRRTRVLHTLAVGTDIAVKNLAIIDIYLVDGVNALNTTLANQLFCDPVAQQCVTSPALEEDILTDWTHLVEIRYRAGVTDPVAYTAREAIEEAIGKTLPGSALIQTARQFAFELVDAAGQNIAQTAAALHNPLIQEASILSRKDWEQGERLPEIYPHLGSSHNVGTEAISTSSLNDENLEKLSRDRLLALSLVEMQAIRNYYAAESTRSDRENTGLPAEATDVELEMIAQTWSEHCKHKILNAHITYYENDREEQIDSLFSTYIKNTTDQLSSEKTYLRSVFHDDSGVIEFDKNTLLCFEAETHNSPSALDPYGGAITGIVGVNRDILGTGKSARPIFNTNVLCFGRPDTELDAIPSGLLHPKRVLAGVHHGIVDGGNQSGIPTVAGGFLFDESYLGKPLVFCGTGGILPAEIGGEGAWLKHIDPGDVAIMVGGRIGKDGIHGATFSSLALDESSPTTAVQIGDPITQKKMGDMLIEARDSQLFKGITDNGAGGLSSSLGEMAEISGGVRVYLDACPLKYQGLAPWEIWLSESQERMSLAVSPDNVEAFLELASRRDVEATAIGIFTDSGYVELFYDGDPVGRLPVDFLHNGLPTMRLTAKWRDNAAEKVEIKENPNLGRDLLELLGDPNIASKEPLIRQYDHEVLAQSIIKPFTGLFCDAPSDGAVLRPDPKTHRGITVSHGICPRYGDIDTYHMAMCAVDEAYRAHIGMGGDPELTAALDNFCWPDPVQSERTPDGEYKLAQLVRACRGLQKACLAYGIPLISGKDSMKNDAVLDGKKVSVRPTLLISLLGVITDVREAVNTDFKNPGDSIYMVGRTRGELGGSAYEGKENLPMGSCPAVYLDEAKILYQTLHIAITRGLVASCHDLADGGFGVALAESALGGRLGAEIDIAHMPVDGKTMTNTELLFSESPSRFIASVPTGLGDAFEACMSSNLVRRLGNVIQSSDIVIKANRKNVVSVSLSQIERAWKGVQW